MRFSLTAASRVFVDLRATGVLRAVGHDPTIVCMPDPLVVPVGDGPIDVSVAVNLPVAKFEVPIDLGAADRERMRAHMLGAEVLDASSFPAIVVHGRYRGTITQGRLEGSVRVRGAHWPIALDVLGEQDATRLMVRGQFEGRLSELGIRPFRAFLGALRLDDWARLRLDASFDVA